MATKKTPIDPKTKMLDAGAKLVGKFGAVNVTRKMVAEATKLSAASVSYYFGSSADLQKALKKHAKKQGIAEPDKKTIEAEGVKLRAHGPRKQPVRRRTAREVEAIKQKEAAKREPIAKVTKVTKSKNGVKVEGVLTDAGVKLARKAAKNAPAAPVKKTAARKPKAPPSGEPLPLPLPPLPALPALH